MGVDLVEIVELVVEVLFFGFVICFWVIKFLFVNIFGCVISLLYDFSLG